MKVRNVITPLLLSGATILTATCSKNAGQKIVKPIEKQTVALANPVSKKYANFVMSCADDSVNLKIENGISFIADDMKYTSKNGKIQGEFINIDDSISDGMNKFTTTTRDFTEQSFETIKMLAGFKGNKENLTLSKADIKEAKSKLNLGTIWNEARRYFYSNGHGILHLGKVKSLKNAEGINLDIYSNNCKVADMQFKIEK